MTVSQLYRALEGCTYRVVGCTVQMHVVVAVIHTRIQALALELMVSCKKFA